MVPLVFERRHRIQGSDVHEVIEGLRLRLKQHLKKKKDLVSATICFRLLWRFTDYYEAKVLHDDAEGVHPGKPKYPSPITWDLIEDWMKGKRIRPPTSSKNEHTLDPYLPR